MSYEDLTARLKKIISLFEEGNLSLEDTIKLYEEGALIIDKCEGMLNEANLRIIKITQERQSFEEIPINYDEDGD